MKTTINTKAIILNSTPYRENDLLVHVYSLDYGRITLLARGAKKITSKTSFSIQSMQLVDINIILKKGISTLIRSNVIDYYHNIKEDIQIEIIASSILEYYYRYSEENKPSLEEYNYLVDSLNYLNIGYSPLLVYLLFLCHIIKKEGINIEVDHCMSCNNTKVVSISLNGGYVCNRHLGNLPVKSIETLKAFRHIYKSDLKDIDKLKINDKIQKELLPIYEYYIEEMAGIHFKSKTFIKYIY